MYRREISFLKLYPGIYCNISSSLLPLFHQPQREDVKNILWKKEAKQRKYRSDFFTFFITEEAVVNNNNGG